MPQTKSAKKELRVATRRQIRNKSVRSLCKSSITKAEKLIFAKELEPAQEAVRAAVSVLDKAAEKKVIHPNNAARRKSRLVGKLNQATALSSVESKPEDTE